MPSWLKSPLISLLYTEEGGKQGRCTAWRRIQERLASPEMASSCSGRPAPALPALQLPCRRGLRSEVNAPLPPSLDVPKWESWKHGTETNLWCELEALLPPFPVSQRTNPKAEAEGKLNATLLPRCLFLQFVVLLFFLKKKCCLWNTTTFKICTGRTLGR